MRSDTQLDYAIFQLTPTRTRCELLVAAQGLTYKLASGLFKPFVTHLHAAEEQLSRGGYSIRLEPPDPNTASWFTKGTMERFVRFVSTPEVLERVSTIGDELTELEQTINQQTNDAIDANGHAQVNDHLNKIWASSFSTGEKISASALLEKPATKRESLDGVENGVEENSKQRLLRALDARRLMLQKEQGMAFARAIAAGFSIEHIGDLVVFAECFGANRLRGACIKFMGLCKKRQEAGLWLQDLALAAAQAKSAHTEMAFAGGAGENGSPNEGRLFMGEEGAEKLSRQGSLEDPTGDYWPSVNSVRPANGPGTLGDFNGEFSPQTWARNRHGGRNQLTPEEMHAGMGYYEESMGSEYRDSESGRATGVVRGHPIMAAWQGQPQNQYIQNASPHSPLGAVHPSMHNHPESPYGFAGPGRGVQAGLPYRPYLGNTYMQAAYAEANPNWIGRVPQPLPAQFWPGTHGLQPNVDGPMRNAQYQDVNFAQGSLPPQLSDQYSQKVGEPWTPEYTHRDEKLESLHDRDAESHGEATRRLPRRSASPSRRSFSPMRKVQIGRSGSKRSGMVVIRNINYIAPNSQNRSSKEDNGAESSGSWSDDGDSGANDQDEAWQTKTGNMKVSDAIGLFENKKSDSNDASKKEVGKSSSNKSVLRRWTGAGAQDDEDHGNGDTVARNRKHLFTEDSLQFPDRMRPKSEGGESEHQAVDLLQRALERRQRAEEEKVGETEAGTDGMLMMQDREASNRSTHLRSTEVFAEQQGQVSKKAPIADDSFIVSNRNGHRDTSSAGDGRTIDPDFELVNGLRRDSNRQPGDRRSSDDSFFVLNRSGVQEDANISWRMPLNLESEMPSENQVDKVAPISDNFEPDDLMMMPERGKDAVNRSWDTSIDYEMQLSVAHMVEDGQHEQDGSELPLENGLQQPEDEGKGAKSKVKNSKMSEREAKAKAMKDMLERRRTAPGNKASQLAEAQQRAEKLRAFKASLQKSKKEKEEEERKRIEDLKTQRRERIAARSNPGGSNIRARPTPALVNSKSSPTSSSRKSTSSVHGSPSPAVFGASPKPSPAAVRHPLSRSVPSLPHDRPKPSPSLRSSTALPNSSAFKSNGLAKPPAPSSTLIRKGTPPPTFPHPTPKNAPPSLKPSNSQLTQPTPPPSFAKPPSQTPIPTSAKKIARKIVKDVKSAVAATSDAPPPPLRNETEPDRQNTPTLPINTADSATVEGAVPENGSASIRAPASTDIASVSSAVEAVSSTSNGKDDSMATQEPMKILEEPKEDASIQTANVGFSVPYNSQSTYEVSPHAQSQADTDDDKEGNGGSPDYHAPIAHVSSLESNLPVDLEADVNDIDGPTSPELLAPASISGPSSTEQYDPPFARLTESPIVTPSANLPQFQVTQQATLPETTPVQNETARSRKKWVDSGSQKSSKGFKRLLLLGRKSSRSPAQNSSDWVSASTTSEGDEDGDEIRDLPSRNGKNLGFGSSLDTTSFSGQASSDPVQSHFKPQADVNFSSSSTKASRSFFSLSTFRSKSSEGKTMG